MMTRTFMWSPVKVESTCWRLWTQQTVKTSPWWSYKLTLWISYIRTAFQLKLLCPPWRVNSWAWRNLVRAYLSKFCQESIVYSVIYNIFFNNNILTDCGFGKQKYLVRLLTYLPGTTIAKITPSAQILYDVGKTAATLDTVLLQVQSFSTCILLYVKIQHTVHVKILLNYYNIYIYIKLHISACLISFLKKKAL